MKKMFLGLLVVSLLAVSASAVFAADTEPLAPTSPAATEPTSPSVPDPTPVAPVQADYQAQMPGVADVAVTNGDTAFTAPQKEAVEAVTATLVAQLPAGTTAESVTVEQAEVGFTFPASGTFVFTWGADQYLFNFSSSKFEGYPGASQAEVKAAAAGSYNFTKTSPYNDQTAAAGKGRFLSAKITVKETATSPVVVTPTTSTGKSGDSSSGCSALTLGAVALFIIPAFALNRRGKK